MIWIMGAMDVKKQIQPAWLKRSEKSIPMVVHSRIMQSAFSKPEGLINFVIGGMVPKTGTLYAFAKLIIAILN